MDSKRKVKAEEIHEVLKDTIEYANKEKKKSENKVIINE